MTKVALSGASGNIGQVLRPALLERGVDLRSAGGRRPLTPLRPGEDVMHGDLRDPAVVDRLLEGVDVLIHMAGTSVERPLPEIIENNLRRPAQVYEGARRHGVKRIVFASSNHAIGMYPVEEKLDPRLRLPPRRLLWPEQDVGRGHGADVLGQARDRGRRVRIGSAIERPTEFRHLSTWFGHEDLMQFTMRCIEAPDVGYCRLGRVGQHAQLLAAVRLRAARLAAGAELGGLRRRDPGQAEPARPGRPALSGRSLRRDGLHAAGAAPGLTGGGRLRHHPPPAGAAPRP